MSMLFYIDERDLTILNPDAVKLCPELAPLMTTQDRLKYLILVYDYESPFKQWPEEDRKRKAKERVWGTKAPTNLSDSVMTKAIEAYCSLQFNTKIELVRTYQKKVDQIQDKIEGENDEKKLASFANTINSFRKYIREIEMEVSQEKQEEGRIQGNQEKSWLEVMQSKKETYAALSKRRELDVPKAPIS